MQKIVLATSFIVVLIGLGVTDALLTVDESTYAKLLGEKQQIADTDTMDTGQPTNTMDTGSSSQPMLGEQAPDGTVRPQSGPAIETVLGASGFEFKAITESIFLSKIIPPEESPVTGTVLLKDNDRIGSIAWVESPKIKIYFIALKEALHTSFTPAVKDLIDETQRREGKPPRNLLTFLDTGINEERIVFVRVRDRLFEVHIAEGHKDELFELIDKLTE